MQLVVSTGLYRHLRLHCDFEGYCYLPLLGETGCLSLRRYAPAAETQRHVKYIAIRWKLKDKTLFRYDMQRAEWYDIKEL
jgi:hypothetical protein